MKLRNSVKKKSGISVETTVIFYSVVLFYTNPALIKDRGEYENLEEIAWNFTTNSTSFHSCMIDFSHKHTVTILYF